MIIAIIGGIGSGKTLTAIHNIVDKKGFCYTNFNLKGYSDYHRLKFEDIVRYDTDEKGNKHPSGVNWNFWNKARKAHRSFNIYLDEVQNVVNSRTSMSNVNKLMSQWLSQIRKLYNDSPDSNLYIISQKIRRIDVNFRELAQLFIKCSKAIVKGKTYIINDYYLDCSADHMLERRIGRTFFIADPYFKRYSTKEIIDFGDSDYI